MRRLSLALFAAAVGVIGCDPPATPPKSTAPQPGVTARETKTTVEVSSRERTDAQAAMQKRFDEIDASYKAFEAKAARASAEAKAKMNQQLAELKVQRDAAAVRLEKFKADSGDAWKEMKGGIDKAFDELKTAYDKAKKNFD